MILFPAIDLKEGKCVRLWRGRMERATVYADDPAAQARAFESQGCEWLHLVDLDGAFAGKPVNEEAVDAILAAVTIPVQLGGGIRDLDTVSRWLNRGVRRVILGTAALSDPDLVHAAAREFPGRIVVGIDAKGGRVAVKGWAEVSEVEALALARRFEEPGVAAFVYTDVLRDGTLTGLNVEATDAFARAVRVPVIASGGLRSLEDIRALLRIANSRIEGVIAGRALYDGRVDLRAALAAVKGEG